MYIDGNDPNYSRKVAAELIKHRKNFRNTSPCMFAFLENCSEKPINSHTVSECQVRLLCNEHGFVIAPTLNFFDIITDEEKPTFKPFGLGNVTTFPGFCQKHDSELFEAIDKPIFEIDEQFVATYLFRTASIELWKKGAVVSALETQDIISTNPADVQRKRLHQYVEELALRDISLQFHSIGACLSKRDFRSFKFVTFQFDDFLPFAFLAPITVKGCPQYGGDPLSTEHQQTILLAVIPSKEGTCAFLVWRANYSKDADVLLDRLKSRRKDLAEILLQIGLEHTENIFFQSNWFKGLKPEDREKLASHFKTSIGTLVPDIKARPFEDMFQHLSSMSVELRTNTQKTKKYLRQTELACAGATG